MWRRINSYTYYWCYLSPHICSSSKRHLLESLWWKELITGWTLVRVFQRKYLSISARVSGSSKVYQLQCLHMFIYFNNYVVWLWKNPLQSVDSTCYIHTRQSKWHSVRKCRYARASSSCFNNSATSASVTPDLWARWSSRVLPFTLNRSTTHHCAFSQSSSMLWLTVPKLEPFLLSWQHHQSNEQC